MRHRLQVKREQVASVLGLLAGASGQESSRRTATTPWSDCNGASRTRCSRCVPVAARTGCGAATHRCWKRSRSHCELKAIPARSCQRGGVGRRDRSRSGSRGTEQHGLREALTGHHHRGHDVRHPTPEHCHYLGRNRLAPPHRRNPRPDLTPAATMFVRCVATAPAGESSEPLLTH